MRSGCQGFRSLLRRISDVVLPKYEGFMLLLKAKRCWRLGRSAPPRSFRARLIIIYEFRNRVGSESLSLELIAALDRGTGQYQLMSANK